MRAGYAPALVYTVHMSETIAIRNIANPDGRALISDHGAHLIEWTPAGNAPVVWMPKAVYLGREAGIRGGVPVIFPWFGPGYAHGQAAGLKPKHGVTRLAAWHFDETGSTDRLARFTLSDADLDESVLRVWADHYDIDTTAGLPKFEATFEAQVGSTLTMRLTVRNTGDAALRFEAALHAYLHVGDVTQARLLGLRGAHYLDAVHGFEPREQADEAVTYPGPVDRVYESSGALRLEDPVLGRAIEITREGSPQTVTWNPGEKDGNAIGDMSEGEWRDFVCIESAVCREHAVTLAPGESYTLGETLAVAAL